MRVNAQRVVAQSTGLFLALTLALFPAACTLRWLVGWLYLLLFFGFFLGVTAWLYRHNPGLLEERLSLSRVDQKGWDRRLFPLLLVFPFVWLAFVSVDAVRFHWSPEPIWLQAVGVLLLLCSFNLFFQTVSGKLVFIYRRAPTDGTWAFGDLDGAVSLCTASDVCGISALHDWNAAVPGGVVRSSLRFGVYDRAGETSGTGGAHIAGRSAGLCRLHGKS